LKGNEVDKQCLLRSWDKIDYLTTLKTEGCKKGAEIGVLNGAFSECLLRNFPNLELYLVDPWKHYPKKDYDDFNNFSQDIQDARYNLVKTLFNDKENVSILRMTSMEAVKHFEDELLDFVYIDANHKYEYVKQDIQEWSKKVKPGGIISGHDFCLMYPNVMQAVKECFAEDITTEFLIIHRMDNIWMYRKGIK